jgi:uncharacterized membrane protein YhiD involved in acid resistance
MQFERLFLSYGQITFTEVVLRITLAFALGFGVSQVYRRTHRGPAFSPSFVRTLVMLSMITSVVMMIIGNSLARAFGLVGAMAIIRFRTALKETRDIAFVFFALAVGMSAGTGAYSLAIISSVAISLCVLVLTFARFTASRRRALLLRFQIVPTDDPEDQYIRTFRKFLRSWRVLDMKSVRMGQFLELSFEVRFMDLQRSTDFIGELTGVEGLERVHLILGEEETEMTP